MREVCKMFLQQCGMAIFIYGLYEDEDGVVNTVMYVPHFSCKWATVYGPEDTTRPSS